MFTNILTGNKTTYSKEPKVNYKISYVLGVAILILTSSAQAEILYSQVSGSKALENHILNQYEDGLNPPQGYEVTLPKGYKLRAVNVRSEAYGVCGVTSFDQKKRIFKID